MPSRSEVDRVVIEFLPAWTITITTNGGAEVRLPGLDPSSVGLDSPLHRSQRYLASADDSVASLFGETYSALRATRTGSRGRLTHAEQDIFRAAVVLAGAGLDTVFKEAMRSCIAIQVDRSCHGGLTFAQRMLNAPEPKVC